LSGCAQLTIGITIFVLLTVVAAAAPPTASPVS